MLKTKRNETVYVLVTLDEGQFAMGERPMVSVHRSLYSARVAMAEDIRATMEERGYGAGDFVRDDECDFAMTKDERYSWSIEQEILR